MHVTSYSYCTCIATQKLLCTQHSNILYLCTWDFIDSPQPVQFFFFFFTVGSWFNLPHSWQHSALCPSLLFVAWCNIKVILECCSQICNTEISTFWSRLVMASLGERKRKKDGFPECYSFDPGCFSHFCKGALVHFQPKIFTLSNDLMSHTSQFSLWPLRLFFWLVHRLELPPTHLIGLALLRDLNNELWLVAVLLWWTKLYPTAFFFSKGIQEQDEKCFWHKYSDYRLRFLGKTNIWQAIINHFYLIDLMTTDFYQVIQ